MRRAAGEGKTKVFPCDEDVLMRIIKGGKSQRQKRGRTQGIPGRWRMAPVGLGTGLYVRVTGPVSRATPKRAERHGSEVGGAEIRQSTSSG